MGKKKELSELVKSYEVMADLKDHTIKELNKALDKVVAHNHWLQEQVDIMNMVIDDRDKILLKVRKQMDKLQIV